MTTEKNSKGLNIALWVVQVLTAALMALASYIKLATPIAELSTLCSNEMDRGGAFLCCKIVGRY